MDERPAAPAMRDLEVDGDRLRIDGSLPETWALDLWREIAGNPGRRAVEARPLPDGSQAMVKLYTRRPAHNLLRRLRSGRALREGRGFEEFGRLNLPLPRLLLYGEHRPLGLHAWGLVVTRLVEAPTVAEACAETLDQELLEATLRLLASIHNAGLTHGDAVTRNFLATRPQPMTFDLASWGRSRPGRRTEDLVRMLGSLIKLGASREQVQALLQHYGTWVTAPLGDEAGLLVRAAAYAAATERP